MVRETGLTVLALLVALLAVGCGQQALTPDSAPATSSKLATPSSSFMPSPTPSPTPILTPLPTFTPVPPAPTPCVNSIPVGPSVHHDPPRYITLDEQIRKSDIIVWAKLKEITYDAEEHDAGCDSYYKGYASLEFTVFETLMGQHKDTVVIRLRITRNYSQRIDGSDLYWAEEDALRAAGRGGRNLMGQWGGREAILLLSTQSNGTFGFTMGSRGFTIDAKYNRVWLPETEEKGVFYLDSPNKHPELPQFPRTAHSAGASEGSDRGNPC